MNDIITNCKLKNGKYLWNVLLLLTSAPFPRHPPSPPSTNQRLKLHRKWIFTDKQDEKKTKTEQKKTKTMQNKKDTDEKEIAICNWNEKLGSSTCSELRATVLFNWQKDLALNFDDESHLCANSLKMSITVSSHTHLLLLFLFSQNFRFFFSSYFCVELLN